MPAGCGAQQVPAAQDVLEEAEEELDRPAMLINIAMISAGTSSRLVAIRRMPSLGGPAALPLAAAALACAASAFTRITRTGWSGPRLGLVRGPQLDHDVAEHAGASRRLAIRAAPR